MGDTSAAPAVSCNHETPTGHHQIRDAHEALHHRLADRVLVLANRLQQAVIDHDHGEWNPSGQLTAQAVSARGGLLGAAENLGARAARNHPGREIRAIVEEDVRARIQNRLDIGVMHIERVIASAEHGHALATEKGDDVVLGRAVVSGRNQLGTSRCERFEQHGGLRFEVQRHADPVPGERPGGQELLARGGE